MERQEHASKKQRLGISAKTMIIPAVIVILLFHTLIILNTIRINGLGQRISAATQLHLAFAQSAKAMEHSVDSLTDYARLFISTGDSKYLQSYFRALDDIHKDDQIPDVSEEAAAELETAVSLSTQRMKVEFHAMHLSAEAYGADLSNYPRVAGAELTPEELAMTPEEQTKAAAALLSSAEYLQSRSEIQGHVDEAIGLVGQQTARSIGQQSAVLAKHRALQWAMTFLIILILAVMCVLLFLFLLIPLQKSAKLVQQGEKLPPNRGFSELRRVARVYNDLLDQKTMLENDLRAQSQTDALTQLPNRLAFQNYVSRLGWHAIHSSVTVFSLDVNGLKETNDTQGHVQGDQLLRDAAECIRDAFGDETGENCFRFGGDEFAAFWIDKPADLIPGAIRKFEAAQAAKGISVSVGYAHTESLSETSVDDLFEQADQNMYEDKFKRKHAV